jgi:Ca-activated chloride channel family protein
MQDVRNRPVLRLFLSFWLLAGILMPVLACRIMPPPWPPHPIPRPPHPMPPRPVFLPMETRQHKATIEIRRHVADVLVEATFYNPNPQQIEGIYIFPIGPKAAVSSFDMTVNGRTMEAELLDADKARSIYEGIVRQLKDPALLEYAGQGLLRARVFPIEPRSEVKVRLSYESALDRDGNLTRFVYPLLSAHPGGDLSIGEVAIEVKVQADSSITSLFVPGFQVETKREGKTASARYSARNFRPERDFEVVFGQAERPVGVDFLTFRKGDEGYFLMSIAPDSELQTQEVGAKDITFVLDTSGSMMGEKIAQAKSALRFCVQALNAGDRFQIVGFASDLNPMASGFVAADAAGQRQAIDFIEGLRAMGGTAIDSALDFTFQQPVEAGRVNLVVFLTDGLPTVGETDAAAILKRAEKAVGNRRVFTFGVGYDVNTRLLEGLSARTRGYASYVRPNEDLEVALSSFYGRIAYPVLADLRLETDGVVLSRMQPQVLPDLFKGAEILVTGRVRDKGLHEMALSGAVGEHRETFRFQADLDGNMRNSFIPRMWATARVAFLQEQISLHGENRELVDEIRQLGREFGILTPYTSFLVVEEGVARERLSEARAAFDRAEAKVAEPESGRRAVERSLAVDRLKSEQMGFGGAPAPAAAAQVVMDNEEMGMAFRAAGIEAAQVQELVRTLHDKTFYFRRSDRLWYDSLIPAGESPVPDQEVVAWSDEFFTLVRTSPELGRYALLGKDVVLRMDDRIIRLVFPKD